MASRGPNVAVDVVRLAEPIVSLHPRPSMLDPVVRAGLLIDLALSGSLANSAGGLEIDTDPTGFAPTDRLVAGVLRHPDKPLAWWLQHAPVNVHAVADELVDSGAWRRRGRGPLRHYRAVHPEQRADELTRLGEALRDHDLGPHRLATVLLLELLPVRDLPSRLAGAGPEHGLGRAAWLVPDLIDNLRRRQAILDASGRDAQTAASVNFIT